MRDTFVQECTHLVDQCLKRIRHCVDQLSHDQLWWQPQGDLNSVGVLLRHVAGNLQQWGVDGIAQTADLRDRESEFQSDLRESASQLLSQLETVAGRVRASVDQLSPEALLEGRTIQGFQVSVMGALMHTIPHFVGHTHQIVQLTRMQLGDKYQFHWDPDADRDVVPL